MENYSPTIRDIELHSSSNESSMLLTDREFASLINEVGQTLKINEA